MFDRFDSQFAIVTGAAEGIGKGIASRLAAEGATVALFDRNSDQLERTVQEFVALGYRTVGFTVDIAQETDVANAFQNVLARFGQLDIMINSAGILGPTNTRITAYSVDDFDKVVP